MSRRGFPVYRKLHYRSKLITLRLCNLQLWIFDICKVPIESSYAAKLCIYSQVTASTNNKYKVTELKPCFRETF